MKLRKLMVAAAATVSAATAGSMALASEANAATTGVFSSGGNNLGQLGNGSTTTNVNAPAFRTAAMPGGVRAVKLASGGAHTVAIASDGKLYTWGSNDSGQLGTGGGSMRSTPAAVVLPTGFVPTAVAAGRSQSIALAADGRVASWGTYTGDGSATARTAPTITPLPVRATAVAAGESFSMALGADGFVYSWGTNQYGVLGDGTINTRLSPGKVALGVSARAIAAGGQQAFAIGTNGRTYAWGRNNFGQLGDGTMRDSRTPVVQTAVPLASIVSGGSANNGAGHSLAIGTDGYLYAWGRNWYGQLGNGSSGAGSDAAAPIRVAGVAERVTAIAVSDYHSLAIGVSGRLYAFGWNSKGQLGFAGGNVSCINVNCWQTVPATVVLPAGLVPSAISAGTEFSIVS